MYFIITNEEENHNDFKYVTGLNIFKGKFNDDPNQLCCKDGFCFMDAANIFKFFNHGIYLRVVTLPINNPEFRIIKDENKWRANMIILGKCYDLCNVETFKYLMECGVDIRANNDFALRWCAKKGYLDVIKFLVENNANIHADDDDALHLSAEHGHLSVIKYLVGVGAKIHAKNDYALHISAKYGYLDIVKFLVDNGANVHANNNDAFEQSVDFGHLSVVKYLVECGADIHSHNDYAFHSSVTLGYLDIYKFLAEKGSITNNDSALNTSAKCC